MTEPEVVHYRSLSIHSARCTAYPVQYTAKTRDMVTCPKCLEMVSAKRAKSQKVHRVILGTGYLYDDGDHTTAILTTDDRGLERRRMRGSMQSALGKKVRLVAEVLP